MFLRLRWLKMPAIVLAALAAACLLFLWQGLPRLLHSRLEQYVAEQSGHRLTFDVPAFNPFTWRLQVSNLRLDTPDGKPLLSLRALTADLSAASLARRALVFDSILLDDAGATLAVQRGGTLNWSPLIEAIAGPFGNPKLALPRMQIRRFELRGGRIDFGDSTTGFTTRIAPVELQLTDLSTLPDAQGRYSLSARTAFGARLRLQGQAALAPPGIAGSLAIENLELAALAPYAKLLLHGPPPAGVARLSADYRATYAGGRLEFALDDVTAAIANFRARPGGPAGPALAAKSMEASHGRFDLARNTLSLDALTLSGASLAQGAPAAELARAGKLAVEHAAADFGARTVAIRRIALSDGALSATHTAAGRIDLFDALAAGRGVAAAVAPRAAPRTRGAPPGKPARAWRFRVDGVALSRCSARLRDEAVTPAVELTLENIAAGAEGVSGDLAAPLPVRMSFHVREGGDVEASGQLIPGAPAAEFDVKVAGIALAPAQPYLARRARVTLDRGQLSAEGHARYDADGARYAGRFALQNVRVLEADTNTLVLAWRFLGSRYAELTETRLDIPRLDVDHLSTRLIIQPDKSVNFAHLLPKPEAPAPAPSAPSAPAPAAAPAPAFLVNVDRVRISDSEMDFADLSLVLPFETHIHNLHGFVNGVSSLPDAQGQVELDGQVDDYGLARAVGQVALLHPAEFTDIKVMFGNIEMTRLTPYSITFAGRRIDSGKLLLNLEYRIRQGQLAGDNQVIIDNVRLGERVKSPEAVDLPLDLAIALLEDADGRIDLGLPVSGNLNDPKFSYGAVVWKAVMNVFGMIATAPFRALGSLFGGFGGGVKLEPVYFDAGAAAITPPQQENLGRIAGVLNKRPSLGMTVHGTWSDADRVAMQDLQLRRALATDAGLDVAPGEDPGPLSTRSPKIQVALEQLYSVRIGAADLAALKEGFRKANPGQLPESGAGRVMSRLSALFGRKRTLSGQEVQQLKGADYYAVLYQRLREREPVADARLQALAQARADAAHAALKAANAPMTRIAPGAPQKADSDPKGVALKLDLTSAKMLPAPAPAPTPAPVPAQVPGR